MIKHTSAPTHTYIYIYIYIHTCVQAFWLFGQARIYGSNQPPEPPLETRSLCTLVFGIVRPLSPLPSKRNSSFGCVHTHTHTRTHGWWLRSRTRFTRPAAIFGGSVGSVGGVTWAGAGQRGRRGGEGSRRDRERGRSNVYYRIQYRCSW